MIIRQIDHIFCTVKQAEDVDRIMDVFRDCFKLPVAWPAHHFHGLWRFYSGGVYLGNVIFEPVFFESATNVKQYGISLEPEELNSVLQELEDRGIAYQGPMPYLVRNTEGQIDLYWINIILDKQPISNLSVFLCEFKPNPIFPKTGIDEARIQLKSELKEQQGGPLGIRQVEEIKLGVKDLKEAESVWQTLLDPLVPIDRCRWRPGEGPAIQLLAAPREGIVSVEIKVDSLAEACRFLAQNDLQDTESENGVRLKIDGLENLPVYLRE